MQITIQAAHLRAVALAMPSNEARKYLNGVRVEVTRTGTTMVDFCAIVAPLYDSALCYGLAGAPAWAKVGEK